jgi:shikimate kinase
MDKRNIILVGFMGTGKTTVGRAVAARLGYVFVDSDHEIERLRGRTVAEIFSQEGEAAFRRYERDFMEHGHPEMNQIVACGGGLIVPDGMLDLVRAKGVVVCLHASIETILERTARNRARPLLAVEDPAERVRTLFAAREPVYRRAGTAILTEGRPVAEIVSHVLRVYQREAKDFHRRVVPAS